MKNWSYKITEGEHAGETLWSGRYCCVAGFILSHTNGDNVRVLAVKRGQDCPDFRGMWCCPCGFLEADETGEEGIVRETWEETGYDFPAKEFDLLAVETDPKLCNKAHVTLMYVHIVNQHEIEDYVDEDWLPFDRESEEVKWIPVDEISKYDWAFGHDKIINELMETL
jgi:8-oxo-dGTP diphosphatase